MLARGVGRVAARLHTAAAGRSASRTRCHGISKYTTTGARRTSQLPPKTQSSASPSPSPAAVEKAHAPRRPRSSRSYPRLIVTALVITASGAIWYFSSPDALPTDRVFNDSRFTPFDLVEREIVSPTSFILTLRPSSATFSSLSQEEIATQLDEPWSHYDLWAVEVKQPQLQIARDYTPLPPSVDGSSRGAIRLWIRAVDGGETSTYLSRLPIGSKVELRGPRGSFDISSRLGSSRATTNPPAPAPAKPPSARRQAWEKARQREVLILAGGTGIATALQAAHALLDAGHTAPSDIRIRILWAVRSQSDVQQLTSPGSMTTPAPPSRPPPLAPLRTWWSLLTGGPRDDNVQTEIGPTFASPTTLTKQILELKEQYGDRLTAHFVVDDEGTYISASRVLEALGGEGGASGTVDAPGGTTQCLFHSQGRHVRLTDGAPNAGRKDHFKRHEDCRCPTGDRPGKDLVLVSGPDGFIAAFAGAKQWELSGQVQGPVGGVLGELERRNPGLLKDRIVLKL